MRDHRGTVVAVALLVMVLTSCEGADDGSLVTPEPEQSTTTSTTLPSIPLDDGPRLEPGTYRVSSEGRTGSDPLLWSVLAWSLRREGRVKRLARPFAGPTRCFARIASTL